MNQEIENNKFYIKDCALISISTGEKAYHLKELYDRLQHVHSGCIYFHFWGGRLKPFLEKREYHNDFAMWAYHTLHDQTLAERLALIDPVTYSTVDALRTEVLRVVDERLDETEQVGWIQKVTPFRFVRSQIVVFSTAYMAVRPEELTEIIPKLSKSAIFYHFIDAHRRAPLGQDDFSTWLQGFGEKYESLAKKIGEIDFYFMTLSNLQKKLHALFSEHFSKVKP